MYVVHVVKPQKFVQVTLPNMTLIQKSSQSMYQANRIVILGLEASDVAYRDEDVYIYWL